MKQLLMPAVLLVLFLPPLRAGASPAFPGGVLDSTGRTAFVATDNGIEAIDLDTGVTRWQSRNASWPLLVAGDQLYALAFSRGSLVVVGLDLAGKGERGFRSEALTVPAWVDASVLRCTWRLEKRSLSLHWQARGAVGRHAAGRATVDLLNTRVTVEKDGDRTPPPPLAVPKVLEKLPVRWHRSIAGQLHALTEEDTPTASFLRRQKKLVLRVWDERTGKEAKSQELMRATRPMVLAGLDGLHVWARESALMEADRDGPVLTPWQVFSGLDGHLVARVPFVAGTTQATLIDTRAYGVATRSGRALLSGAAGRSHELYAIDLGSGKVLWRRAIKETGAQGR